jgi:hypothetical protein
MGIPSSPSNGRCLSLAVTLMMSCACESRVAEPPTDPTPPTVATKLVEFRGRIIDVDNGEGIPGTNVSITQVQVDNRFISRAGPVVSTDANGRYVMTVELPETFSGEAELEIRGPGLEPAWKRLKSSEIHDATIDMYRTIRLRPGESVETQLVFRPYTAPSCELWCRRIIVDGWSPGGPLIEVQLVPLEDEQHIGIFAEPWPLSGVSDPPYPRIAQVAGELWIMGAPTKVRLTAR